MIQISSPNSLSPQLPQQPNLIHLYVTLLQTPLLLPFPLPRILVSLELQQELQE